MESSQRATVRAAKLADIEAITGLAEELGYPASATEMVPRFSSLHGRAEHAVLVADLAGAVIGWIHVYVVESLESAPFAEIRGMVVTETQRGRGVGQDLISAAEEWGAKNKCARIRVRSNSARTQARNFYEKQGYVIKKNQNVFDKQLRGSYGKSE